MDNVNEARSPKTWVWLVLFLIGMVAWLVAVAPVGGDSHPIVSNSVLGYVYGFEQLFGGNLTVGIAVFLVVYFVSWFAFISPGLGSGGVKPGGHSPSKISILGVAVPGSLVMTGLFLTVLEAWNGLDESRQGMVLAGLLILWFVIWVVVFNIKWRGGTRLAQMYRMTIGVFWVSLVAFLITAAMHLLLSPKADVKSCAILAAGAVVWALGAHAVVGITQNKYLSMTDQSVCSFCGAELSEAINKGETNCPACSRPIPAWAKPRDGAAAPAAAEPAPAE